MTHYINEDARLHRNGQMPLIGKKAIRAFLSEKPVAVAGEPLKADVSQSADLGYTYGTYELRGGDLTVPALDKGYYARFWKGDAHGSWKIVLDTTIPLPAEPK